MPMKLKLAIAKVSDQITVIINMEPDYKRNQYEPKPSTRYEVDCGQIGYGVKAEDNRNAR